MRAIVSHRTKPKDRNKRMIGQISQSAAMAAGGKGMSFLEDDLDTGEGLPTHLSPQSTNESPEAKLVSTFQISSSNGAPSSLWLPTCMLLFLIPFSFAAMRLPDCCLCVRHSCLPLGSALTLSYYAVRQKIKSHAIKEVVGIDSSWRNVANLDGPNANF